MASIINLSFLLLLLSGDVELNPGPVTPKEILQKYSDKLTKAIAININNVTNGLHAKDLITQETRGYVTTVGVANADKANKVMLDIEGQLDAYLDDKQYLTKVCNVLSNQGGAIKQIANVMLQELDGTAGGTSADPIPTAQSKELSLGNVDSKGEATCDSPSDVLRSMNEIAVADKLEPEKHAVAAISIFNTHHPLLSQSLCDPVNVTIMLHREGVITQQVVTSVESASLFIPKQCKVLLDAIREVIQFNYNALQTFASVLCKFPDNAQLGVAIHGDYSKCFHRNDEYIIVKAEEVEIPVLKSKSREFSSIRASFGRMKYKVSKAIKNKSPPIEDLKEFICCYNRDLRAKLDNCDRISSVVSLIFKEECSLTDIELLQIVAEVFQVTKAEKYIEEYKIILKEFCKDISLELCLKEKFDDVEHLKCEKATYIFDWRPDKKMLNDIIDILSKTSGKLVKIKYIDTGCSIIVTCSFPSSRYEDVLKEVTKNLNVLKKNGLLKLTVGYRVIYDHNDMAQGKGKEEYDMVGSPKKEPKEKSKINPKKSKEVHKGPAQGSVPTRSLMDSSLKTTLETTPGAVGLALIVSNDHKGTHRELKTTKTDGEFMKKAFEWLGYATLRMHNWNLTQLEELLRTANETPYPESCRRIAFVFAGHGRMIEKEHLQLVMNDGKPIDFDSVQKYLSPPENPHGTIGSDMVRLFFLDTCRGKQHDAGMQVPSCTRGDIDFTRIPKEVYENCLVCFSTRDGFAASDDGDFLPCVAEKLTTCDEHITAALTEAKAEMQDKFQNPEHPIQSPETIDRLTTKVYLLREKPCTATDHASSLEGPHSMKLQPAGGGSGAVGGGEAARGKTGKELNLDNVTQVFTPSASHYSIIGIGLGVDVADLIPLPNLTIINFTTVFQRWIDSGKDVTWGKLLQVCDNYPGQLGRAKANLEKFLSS